MDKNRVDKVLVTRITLPDAGLVSAAS